MNPRVLLSRRRFVKTTCGAGAADAVCLSAGGCVAYYPNPWASLVDIEGLESQHEGGRFRLKPEIALFRGNEERVCMPGMDCEYGYTPPCCLLCS